MCVIPASCPRSCCGVTSFVGCMYSIPEICKRCLLQAAWPQWLVMSGDLHVFLSCMVKGMQRPHIIGLCISLGWAWTCPHPKCSRDFMANEETSYMCVSLGYVHVLLWCVAFLADGPAMAPCCVFSPCHHVAVPLGGSCYLFQVPWLGSSISLSTGWPTWRKESVCLPSGTAMSNAVGLPLRPLLRTGTSVPCGRNGQSCWWISQRWVSGQGLDWKCLPFNRCFGALLSVVWMSVLSHSSVYSDDHSQLCTGTTLLFLALVFKIQLINASLLFHVHKTCICF